MAEPKKIFQQTLEQSNSRKIESQKWFFDSQTQNYIQGLYSEPKMATVDSRTINWMSNLDNANKN